MQNVCRICNTPIRSGGYALKDGAVHKECRRMQNRGLLTSGRPFSPMDSTGKPCVECGQVIDGPHAHKKGLPYHRECV